MSDSKNLQPQPQKESAPSEQRHRLLQQVQEALQQRDLLEVWDHLLRMEQQALASQLGNSSGDATQRLIGGMSQCDALMSSRMRDHYGAQAELLLHPPKDETNGGAPGSTSWMEATEDIG